MTSTKRTATEAARELNASDPLGDLATSLIYSADRGASVGFPVWEGETRGDAVRRRRAVLQPSRDAARAESRSRVRVGWQSAAWSLGLYR